MYIQYNLSDGDVVQIQATNNVPADPELLAAQGRGQYKVADSINVLSTVNIKTGEVIAPTINQQSGSTLVLTPWNP